MYLARSLPKLWLSKSIIFFLKFFILSKRASLNPDLFQIILSSSRRTMNGLVALNKRPFFKKMILRTYDHIEWTFILTMLQALGFDPRFIQMVNMLFADAFACITIKGHWQHSFDLFRSIKQWCPLALSLYVLVAKGFRYLLAQSVSHGLVQGITLPESSICWNTLDH